MNEKVVFLEDFLLNELYIVEEDCNIKEFVKKNALKNFLLLYENINLKVGDYVFVKKNKNTIHIVRPNETLDSIAMLYNTTAKNLMVKNNIKKVFIGQQLLI